ncbi:hypothetical protein BaRGS_00022624 [Batillaria attramentaria]|uniref:Secreted protein n=1 Tax=Batillaria attramentaria TaxID=370345 RepID=A0ABD0KFY7_9CAEN
MLILLKITAILTVMAAISERLSRVAALSPEVILWQKADLVDVTFMDALLSSSKARSEKDCARLCGYSLIYTFTTSSGECRCHSSDMTSLSANFCASWVVL